MQALNEEQLARERTYLMGIAYRMLGSASDAEDVVQEALVRAARESDLRSPRAFLTTVVTRLCLDELGSARRRRESYVGPYLPEPVATDGFDGAEQRENVSLALLVLLDELSPLERAVFVLRDVFDLEFSEIGAALGRNEAACRKLLSRAREHIAHAEHNPPPPSQAQQQVANAFFGALASGDLHALVEILAEEATLLVDHGGKAAAARNLLQGNEVVAKFLHGLYQKGMRDPDNYRLSHMLLNGAPGLLLYGRGDTLESAFMLQIGEHAGQLRLRGMRIMRNPDKLQALARAVRNGQRLPVQPATSGDDAQRTAAPVAG